MGVYIEKKNQNTLPISGSNEKVFLKVDCQYGTISSVSLYLNKLITVNCGERKEIGTVSSLKEKTIRFTGVSGNPSKSPIKVVLTIQKEDAEKIKYTFPDDYNGEPDYDEADKEPTYIFYVKFN